MNPLLSAYILAGGEPPKLAQILGLPVNKVLAWIRGDAIPDGLLSRIEYEAQEQAQRRYTEVLESASDPATSIGNPKWIERLLDLDRAWWIVHGMSVFEFRLRVALRLAKMEADGDDD